MTYLDPHIQAALVNAIYSTADANPDLRPCSRTCAKTIAARILHRFEDRIDVYDGDVTFSKTDLETVLCDLRGDAPHLFG